MELWIDLFIVKFLRKRLQPGNHVYKNYFKKKCKMLRTSTILYVSFKSCLCLEDSVSVNYIT